MSGMLERARLMREHRRHDEAVAQLVELLSQEPNNMEAHLELALNRVNMPGQKKEALEDIGRAIAIAPDEALLLAVKSNILSVLDRYKEALEAAQYAVALDPELVFGWDVRSQALGGLGLWKEAESSARKALALDPDNETASNHLACFLRMQGRTYESDHVTKKRLERDPQNAMAFANVGWSALQRGERDKAEEQFLEALRLDPEYEYARSGLRSAYKARSVVFRLYLTWAFMLQRYTQKKQWLIIIGLYLGFRFGRAMLSVVHPLLAAALVVVYLLLVFGSWLADGIGNFLLLKDSKARHTLTFPEKLDGLVVGLLFFGGLILLVLGVTVLPLPVAVFGGVLMGSAVPASLVFDNSSKPGRMVFGGLALAIITCGLASLYSPLDIKELETEGFGNQWSGLALLGLCASTWLGMIPRLRRGTPE